jgi:hypothetical protein
MAGAGGIPVGQWSGSDATNALRESVEQFNATAGRQTAWLLGLTWTIAALTLVMTIGVGLQIYTAVSAVRGSPTWVLWLAQSAAARASVPPSAWTPLGGHETKKACTQVMNRLKGTAKGDSHMMCLSDTVDPRGPKGK